MTVKGCLLSSTATVKCFQAENIEVHPFESRNHMWYQKIIVLELQGQQKSLLISLSVSIQYWRVTDGQPHCYSRAMLRVV